METTITESTKVLYTAKTHTTGGREHGVSRSSDSRLDIKLSVPGTIHSITNTLATELAPRKIRVNSIAPGAVLTEGTHKDFTSDFGQQFISTTPLGRVGFPKDIAKVAVFLASDAEWLTGDRILASGGLK
jgi:3-oxoacyl-[acyl-carrier protein] reductase